MSRQNPLARLAEYERANLQCAKIIAANPEKYRGLMQMWARRVLSHHPEETIGTQANVDSPLPPDEAPSAPDRGEKQKSLFEFPHKPKERYATR